MKPKLAIVAPSLNAYTETFIQAHKSIPDMEARYYYGDPLPERLEGKGELDGLLWRSALRHYLGRLLGSQYQDRREDALARSLRREGIDCVLAEYGVTGAKILNVCKSLKLPLVVVFFGYEASVYTILRQYGVAYRDMFQYASAVVVVGRAMQKKLEDLGCPPGKIHYSPSGPYDDFFKVMPAFESKLFVSTGRFVDKKAHYYTILAFKNVLESHPDASLIIAGEGTLFNACFNLVRYFKIEHAVSLPGAISLDQFSKFLSDSRAYVQHSITALDGDMEGTPVAVMEASAAGLPVIATRHAGIQDVVINGETGFLVDEHDVEGMTRHMLRLLEDRDLAKKMGKKGREFIHENFSRQKHLDTLSRIVQNAVHSHAGGLT